MLKGYLKKYRKDLTDRVVPFWLNHSLDRRYGGYFSCLERDGTVYDTKKYLWLQGREIWSFSRLYNELERRPEYLDAASLGVKFMRQYGRDSQGRVYFSVTREGKPFFYQRKPYAAVFYMLGLLEYSKASRDNGCFDESVEMFWKIVDWIREPSLMDRPTLAGQLKASNLANVMVLASMAIELAKLNRDPKYLKIMQDAIDGTIKHYDPKRRIFMENVPFDATDITHWPEGRFFNPGHSIEVAWFLLHMLEFFPNARHQKLALDALEGSLEFGWDRKYGGLTYFMDVEGKSTLQLESSMKLWWPHTEALYALVLAYTLTREKRWIKWLEKIDDYCDAHFVDKKYGEWFGYCDRQGKLTHTCKGGNYKGFFHVPRALLFSIQKIEQMEQEAKVKP
jgi:N-acylglucosamine 2-epimerase